MKNSYIKKYETTNIFDDVDIFPVIKKNNDFKPLKIFISYGHPEREICRIICECLVRRGHKVWFDENNILPGNNWRASIVEGITDCDSFIAGLSKHYVKENSVCLDELSVAIGVKKGNIKTILLDSEKDVDPPSSVSCVQWLDMHDWMEQKENKKQFIDWLQKKLKQLIETIEAVPDRNFAGDSEQIRKKLCPVYTTTKQSYLLKQLYVERVWLNKIIESWLKDFESEKMCIVYGLPGSGKSIFAANYMHYNSRVAATIFCEADKPQFNSINNIIRVLSYQLACRLPEYREMLKYIIKDIKINFLNEQELFDVLIAQPLCDNIDGNHDPMCILIDGLDECRNGDRNILSEVLQIYANRLPNWIKILILSRPESEIIGALGKSFSIDINKYKKENECDIEKYVKNILNNNEIRLNEIESITQKIVKKSEGMFLYAKVVLDELIKNKITLKELDGLQEGLNSIFFQWFSRMFQSNNEYEKYFVDAISIMLWEKIALPKDEIKIILGWNNRKLNNFIQRMEVFLQEETDIFGKETIKFSHMYIREWLMTKYAGRFQCFAEDGLQSMKTAYLDLYFRKGCKALTEYEILHIQEILINVEEDVKTIVNDTDLFWQIMRLGFYCDDMLKIQDGLYCYEKALRLVQENNTVESVRNKVEAYINIGKSLQRVGDFKLAEKYWKEALYKVIKAVAMSKIEENYYPTSEFWIVAFQYSNNYIKSLSYTTRILVLKQACQYTDDDLIHDATINLVQKYRYLIKIYNDLSTISENQRIEKFYDVVSSIVPIMLIDKFRHISCNNTSYTEYNLITGNYLEKIGHCIKPTYSPMSLEQNISEDCSDSKDTILEDTLISSANSTEDVMITRDFITKYAELFFSDSHLMFSYICFLLKMEIDMIAKDLVKYDNTKYFKKLFFQVKEIYGISLFYDYMTHGANTALSYKNYMNDIYTLKKQLFHERTDMLMRIASCYGEKYFGKLK